MRQPLHLGKLKETAMTQKEKQEKLRDADFLDDHGEMEEHRKHTLQNGLLAFLKKIEDKK